MLAINKDQWEVRENPDWAYWCRLCACKSFEEIDVSAEYGKGKKLFLSAIEKWFNINLKSDDAFPKMVCPECLSRIDDILEFSERINNVQHMFKLLNNWPAGKHIDKNALRLKYGLLDGENKNNNAASAEKSKQLETTNKDVTREPDIKIKEENMQEILNSTKNDEALPTSIQDLHKEKELYLSKTANVIKLKEAKRIPINEGTTKYLINENVVMGEFNDSLELLSQTILAHINAQNYGINTESWKVLERIEKENIVHLVCNVDDSSMSKLISLNFEIWFGFGKAKFSKISS